MKEFKIEIKNVKSVFWDSDIIADTIPAENKEEAFELAKQYLLDAGEPETEIFNLIFRITDLNAHVVSIKGGWE